MKALIYQIGFGEYDEYQEEVQCVVMVPDDFTEDHFNGLWDQFIREVWKNTTSKEKRKPNAKIILFKELLKKQFQLLEFMTVTQ